MRDKGRLLELCLPRPGEVQRELGRVDPPPRDAVPP